MQYDRLSVYGFGVDYPQDWRVELKPESDRNRGNLVFHSPTRDNMLVSWEILERVQKRYSSLAEQVDGVLENIRKSRGVKSVEVMEREELEINGHTGVFTHLKVTIIQGFFPKKRVILQELWSLHVHCEQTSRFFALYGSSSSDERSLEQAEIFKHM
jgi:hypothetical protein